jgi:5-methyltetrahydropteroyltriglutamate--homocysteine methyltransferase
MNLLPTSVIGSYAWPSWYVTAVEAIKADQYGPADIEETLNDAVNTAVRDQVKAGIDIITDGEMRRLGFFTADFYGRLSGLQVAPPLRRVGPAGHDQRERYEALGQIMAPDGLGLVAEFEYVRQCTDRVIKVPCPGPFTLAGRISTGATYTSRMEVAEAFSEIIHAELVHLVEAGASHIQLDEPSYAVHPDAPAEFVDLFNRTVEGIDARIGLHLCFGNFVGRPVALRTYKPLFPHILDLRADELALEFANREMVEIELGAQIAEAGKTLAVGVVDVKNYYVEQPEDVAMRIRRALACVPAEQLVVVPDCGLSQTARWAARAKLQAMVAGANIVRNELSG